MFRYTVMVLLFVTSSPVFAIQKHYDFPNSHMTSVSSKSINEYCLDAVGTIGQAGDAADDLDSDDLDSDIRSIGYSSNDFTYSVSSIFKHKYNVYFAVQLNSYKKNSQGFPNKQGILIYEYNCGSDEVTLIGNSFYSPNIDETYFNLFGSPVYDDRYIIYADLNGTYSTNKTYLLLDTEANFLSKGNFYGDLLSSDTRKAKTKLLKKRLLKKQKTYILSDVKFTGFQKLEADIQFLGESTSKKIFIDLLQGGKVTQK